MTPVEADRAFHVAIAEATENTAVTACVESLWEMRTFPKGTKRDVAKETLMRSLKSE